jgi:hypothetical protein
VFAGSVEPEDLKSLARDSRDMYSRLDRFIDDMVRGLWNVGRVGNLYVLRLCCSERFGARRSLKEGSLGVSYRERLAIVETAAKVWKTSEIWEFIYTGMEGGGGAERVGS